MEGQASFATCKELFSSRNSRGLTLETLPPSLDSDDSLDLSHSPLPGRQPEASEPIMCQPAAKTPQAQPDSARGQNATGTKRWERTHLRSVKPHTIYTNRYPLPPVT